MRLVQKLLRYNNKEMTDRKVIAEGELSTSWSGSDKAFTIRMNNPDIESKHYFLPHQVVITEMEEVTRLITALQNFSKHMEKNK